MALFFFCTKILVLSFSDERYFSMPDLIYTAKFLDWLQSFLFYIYYLFLYIIFFIMILFNPTKLPMAEQKLSSQGTEVNKNSTRYTSVVSPQKKQKKKKEKKNKERVWGQTTKFPLMS